MNRYIFLLVCFAFFICGCGQKKEKTEQENLQITEPFEEPITPKEENIKQTNKTTTQNITLREAIVPDKPTVKDIQIALKNANLYNGNIDGVFGPKTKKAVEEFQAKNNLVVDGKVGPKTWEKLKKYYNKQEDITATTTKKE